MLEINSIDVINWYIFIKNEKVQLNREGAIMASETLMNLAGDHIVMTFLII